MRGSQSFKKTRMRRIGIPALFFVLVAVLCPAPFHRVPRDSLLAGDRAVFCSDALQAILPGCTSAVPPHILRATGTLPIEVSSVSASYSKLLMTEPAATRLSASICARSPVPFLATHAIKARAPPDGFPPHPIDDAEAASSLTCGQCGSHAIEWPGFLRRLALSPGKNTALERPFPMLPDATEDEMRFKRLAAILLCAVGHALGLSPASGTSGGEGYDNAGYAVWDKWRNPVVHNCAAAAHSPHMDAQQECKEEEQGFCCKATLRLKRHHCRIGA